MNLRLDNYRKTYYNGLKTSLIGGLVTGFGSLVYIIGVNQWEGAPTEKYKMVGRHLMFIGSVTTTVGFCISLSAPSRLKLNVGVKNVQD
jgi:hypothetical protein